MIINFRGPLRQILGVEEVPEQLVPSEERKWQEKYIGEVVENIVREIYCGIYLILHRNWVWVFRKRRQ